MHETSTTPSVNHSPISTQAHQLVLTEQAIEFLSQLHRKFEPARQKLLVNRIAVQTRMDAGVKFEFPERTAHIRSGHWTISEQPAELRDRRVEMIVRPSLDAMLNAVNAKVPIGIIDFEDGVSPTWTNILSLHGFLSGYENEAIRAHTTTWMVRPRALHCDESHFMVDGEMMSATLFDFGLYFIHNAERLSKRDAGVYYYLSKLEHYREARWWNDVMAFGETYLGLQNGLAKATLTVETIPAVFQLNEMLYELREHSAGLSCGKQNYLFSFIKHFGAKQGFILPDREQLSLSTPFLEDYAMLIIQVAKRRKAPAIGITFAGIPALENDTLREECISNLKRIKAIEIKLGFDGTRVVDADLIDEVLSFWPTKQDHANQEEYLKIDAAQMLRLPPFKATERQIRRHIHTGLNYLANWLSGKATIEILGHLEDKTGAEIARSQLWQWMQAKVRLSDGTTFDKAVYLNWFDEEFQKVRSLAAAKPDVSKYLSQAAELFLHLTTAPGQTSFITDLAYPLLVSKD